MDLFARWKVVRSCAAEFGPPPGARYADQLAAYTDAQLLAGDRDEILRKIRARQDEAHLEEARR